MTGIQDSRAKRRSTVRGISSGRERRLELACRRKVLGIRGAAQSFGNDKRRLQNVDPKKLHPLLQEPQRDACGEGE